MDKEELKNRTKNFALRILKLSRTLNNNMQEKIIAKQILRSGTSVAANYRAALRGKSKADFISKLGIVIEEADETMFWLELIMEDKILRKELIENLYRENNEIVAIMVTTRNTAIKNKKSEI